jgi:ParB-like chromosome segregation protein Spo0J
MEKEFSKTLEELKEVATNSNKETRFDVFQIDPRLIVVELGHNVRDFDTEKVQNHVRELADNIKENGVMTPLECRKGEKVGIGKDDKGKEYDIFSYYLIDGECRKRAVDLLFEEGVVIARVPVLLEKKGSNPANRVLDMLNANIGLRFTPIELAFAYKKLLNMGYTESEIAKQVGKTLQYVNECLSYINYSPRIQKGLLEGKITANNVRQLNKKLKDIEPDKRLKETEKRLLSAINRASEVGEKEKAGKHIDMSVEQPAEPSIKPKRGRPKQTTKKFDIEIFIDHLKYLLELLPSEKETYKLSELKEVIEMLEDGNPLLESIDKIFNN